MLARCPLFALFAPSAPSAVIAALVLSVPAFAAQDTELANLGLASYQAPHIDVDIVVVRASEAAQGQSLNPDADKSDSVLHVHRPSTGITTNLGLAGDVDALADGWILFRVFEWEQGGTDLNGDGDSFDGVAHVHDVVSGVTLSLGVAGEPVHVSATAALVRVSEAAQNQTDFNGDGDTTDHVLQRVSLADGAVTNLGLSSVLLRADPAGCCLLVSEAGQGGTDLNGDGDDYDLVLHLYDARRELIVNTALAVPLFDSDAFGGGVFTSLVDEAAQGHVDLNGDGDTVDHVLHLHTLPGGVTVNLGVATSMVDGSPRMLVAGVSETAQGVDLNSDGDLGDTVARVFDLATGAEFGLGLAVVAQLQATVDGGRAVLTVTEAGQGATDLNGDGDTLDNVAFSFDGPVTTLTNLALAVERVHVGQGLCLLEVSEEGEGADLDGDGDQSGAVLHVHDLVTGTTHALGIEAFGARLDGGLATWLTHEAAAGRDLNGDGDLVDQVLQAWDPLTAAVLDLGLAAPIYGWAGAGRQVAALVTESAQGKADLNQDGDVGDAVVHVVSLPLGAGLATDVDVVSLASGGVQSIELDTGPSHAGDVYWLLGSTSGQLPGTALGAHTLPLNADAYLAQTLAQPDQIPLVGALGVLDALGRSDAPAIAVPPASDPTLAGLVVHHACVVLDPSAGFAVALATNAGALVLVP